MGIRTTGLGIDDHLPSTLDRWQREGGVNAVFVTTQSQAGYAATPHARFYATTILGPPPPAGDRLTDILGQASPRGIAVYSALTETPAHDQARRTPGWVDVMEVDVFGRRGAQPCFRNSDYRSWWLSMTEDQVKSYPIDGLCFTVDRTSPLAGVLGPRGRDERPELSAPGCFCTACQAQAARRQIDVDRAREGYRQLLDPTGPTALAVAGGENPAVVLFRILLRFPEVVAWESLWMQGYLGLQQQLFGAVKAVAPQLAVGWQISERYASSPLYRAQDQLAERARSADFLCHGTVRRRRVERAVLGVSALTADAFAADVLGDVLTFSEADKAVAGTAVPQGYVQVGHVDDVDPALQAGADGVIYTEVFGLNEASPQLTTAGQAVRRRGDTQ